jgi:chloramphenicol 3-O phosphotransferase
MPESPIIVLNGTSSAGKTSIGVELQQIMKEPYLLVGFDHFVMWLPRRYFNLEGDDVDDAIYEPTPDRLTEDGQFPPGEGFRWIRPPEGSAEGVAIKAGPLGHRIIATMHRAVALMASRGHPVILDHVLLEPKWLDDLLQVLRGYPVLFVGVRCPLAVVEQRERERGDRVAGQARGHFESVHAHAVYDLEVDTSLLSPTECALRIVNHLRNGSPADAFDQMRTRRAAQEG